LHNFSELLFVSLSLVSCPHPFGITKLFGGLIDQTIPCAAVPPSPVTILQ